MNAKCVCTQKQISERKSISPVNTKTIFIDFGKVPFLHKKCKDILIDLEQPLNEFEVNKTTNCHGDIFTITPTSGKLNDEENQLKLKCYYKPQAPFLKNADVFTLTSSSFSLIITARGESTGPMISASDKHIKFFITPKEKNGKQVFSLKNVNNMPTEFIIDMDHKQKLFIVKPTRGIIEKEIYIRVTFNPKEYGTYYQQLNFLIFGNEPEIVSLFGSYSKEKIDPEQTCYINYPVPFEDTVNYNAYFKDICQDLKSEKKSSPVYLNTTDLDLGIVIIKNDDLFSDDFNARNVASVSRETLAVSSKNFSVINDMKHEIVVSWIEDDNVFKILPKKANVPPGATTFFKCFFTPYENEKVYFRTFTAQVYWLCDYAMADPCAIRTVIVPLTLSINVQGISFQEDQMPLTNIGLKPRHLCFAPSLVGTISYENMLIFNKLPGPVIFKLVAPVKSRITMKPMTGIIKTFVIISARFRANKKPKPLMEVWNLIINGQESKPISFCVQGLADLPAIEVGNNNELILSTAQVDTVAKETFLMKNKCCFNLSYTFISPVDKLVSIIPDTGEILPYEEISITVLYHAKACAPKVVEMVCKLYVKHKLDAIVGQNYDHLFIVYCDRAYTQLCATPLCDSFDVFEFGAIIESNFNLFNFGQSSVSFLLHVNSLQSNNDKISIVPNSGDIGPGQHLQINLKIQCLTMGDNNFNIEYSQSNILEKTSNSNIFLLPIAYHTTVGKIQIAEVVEYNFGALFTKLHFWEYLKIDRLNEQFNEVEPNNSDSINIQMPDCVEGSKHYLTLLVENPTQFDTEIIFKRKKVCNCETKQTLVTFNTTKLLYDCPHRKVVLIETTNEQIEKKSSKIITFTISYHILRETTVAYDIHLSHKRLFTLYFRIYGIPADESRVSAYNTDFIMAFKPVHLSTRVPPTQFFWLYNHTQFPATIEVKKSKITEIYKKFKYNVFECTQDKGEISPFGKFALKFKFCPIEHRNYTAKIPLLIKGEETRLTLKGTGTLKSPVDETYFHFSMPQFCKSTGKFPVVFSVDYLIVNCMPICNYTERIIFIQNITTDIIIYYEWDRVDIPNFIKIQAQEENGYLLPSQSHAITLQIQSFDQSLISDFVLSCRLAIVQQVYSTGKNENMEKHLLSEIEQYQEIEVEKTQLNGSNSVQCKIDAQKQENLKKDTTTYIMTLTIRVNVVYTRDLTNFVKPPEIFRYHPQNKLKIDGTVEHLEKERKILKNNNLHKNLIEDVLRMIISDVVFDDPLKEILEGIRDETDIYYSQLSLGKKEPQTLDKEHRLKQYFARPSLSILADTLKTFIHDGILETFELSTLIGNRIEQDNKKEQDTFEKNKETADNIIVEQVAPVCKNQCICKKD
ncbi:cilia- and flagella-associated protein 65 isoform X3 [Diabrotica undecimpunctata]|uniref:cilia- and flagella-associated protein 65 isoform X3 n=1 Tax=Diabrotica undecimpunctata TaxID=50387 RepID=UPI003B633ABD